MPRHGFRGIALFVATATVFGILVTVNSGGYRYGIPDQAFLYPYYPAGPDAWAGPPLCARAGLAV